MKKMRSFLFVLVFFLSAINQGEVFAKDNTKSRCDGELTLSKIEAEERNAWARKCGYLVKEVEEFANKNGNFIVFKNEVLRNKVLAPVKESASCIPDLEKSAYCRVHVQTGEA